MADNLAAALLLHNSSSPLMALTQGLRGLSVRTRQARTCVEASQILNAPEPPEVVFTETELPDGNWQDVVRLAQAAPKPTNVIVVSRLVDIRLYVEAVEKGAFDFIAPPFEPLELAHVLRCAVGNVAARRNVQAGTAQLRAGGTTQLSLPTAS
jgi:DNA-binding NtrC family response regulator